MALEKNSSSYETIDVNGGAVADKRENDNENEMVSYTISGFLFVQI
jgi:hypothetical protein